MEELALRSREIADEYKVPTFNHQRLESACASCRVTFLRVRAIVCSVFPAIYMTGGTILHKSVNFRHGDIVVTVKLLHNQLNIVYSGTTHAHWKLHHRQEAMLT